MAHIQLGVLSQRDGLRYDLRDRTRYFKNPETLSRYALGPHASHAALQPVLNRQAGSVMLGLAAGTRNGHGRAAFLLTNELFETTLVGLIILIVVALMVLVSSVGMNPCACHTIAFPSQPCA